MAIKVNGIEVISQFGNSPKFTVTGTEGAYTDLQPAIGYGNNSSTSMEFPPHGVKANGGPLTADITWYLTKSTFATGRQVTMFVDASATGYNQGFSVLGGGGGTILYPNDTEPTWTDARYWLHRITCWSDDTASVISTSWSA
tara:strand:- start:287 stop:712 length:426 start_codon:yes stop_codon:yes gene_type:complete